jgi:hypothetical protein
MGCWNSEMLLNLNNKYQITNIKQIPMTKTQYSKLLLVIGLLEFGAGVLEFH